MNTASTSITRSTAQRGRALKLWLALPAAALALAAGSAAHAQAYVNVTVGGAFAPGVYGQIALGNNPPPPLVNVQPIVVGRPVFGVPPMYLYAPPEHQRDWARYCDFYRACGHPVHFVQVDPRQRWWEQHRTYLREPEHYRRVDERDNRRWERHDDEHRRPEPRNRGEWHEGR